MDRRARRLLVGAIVAALALGASIPATGSTASELDRVRREISELSQRIDQSRAESRRVAQELAASQAQVEVAEAELTAAQARVEAVRGQIAAEEANLATLTARLAAIEESLAVTRETLRSTKADLELQAVQLYMDASAGMGALVLGFEDSADLAVGLVYADGVLGNSEDLIDAFEVLKREEERQQATVAEERSRVAEVLADLDRRRQEMEAEAARVEVLARAAAEELASAQALLDRIHREIAAAEQHKDGLEQDAARLERELARLQSQQGEKPGVLAWPVAGRVSSPFGFRVHPIFATRRLHTGIDIDAQSGAPVAAAGAGTVILAETYGGYGNAVVVDHGGGLATLYAHLSRIAVSAGQAVAKGDAVGSVGCTGLCTGPHLHFETRESGVPVDPLKYLRG